MVDHTIEGARRREGPDVELIKDEPRERQALPSRISPGVQLMIDHLRQAEHTVGLRGGAWVGPRLAALDRKAITRPWTGRRIGAFPPATFELGHWSATPAGNQVDALFAWRPNPEPMHRA